MAQTLREWLTPIGVIVGIAFLAWFVWDDMDRLRSDVHSIEVRVAVLELDVSYLKTDVADIKEDVAQLEGDVAQIKGDVAQIKGDVAQLREDYFQMREDIAEIRAILLNRLPTNSDGGESDSPSAAQPSNPAAIREASAQP